MQRVPRAPANHSLVRIDETTKHEVLAKTDIGEYIGSFVQLRKRGNDLVGLCPFHGENTPSFHVHPDRGFFKCFGCGAAGDVIRFLQLRDNLSFVEALTVLAKRVGVELEPETPQSARLRSEKESIYHANEVATAWFHRVLLHEREGEPGRRYCERRGLTAETIAAFSLGYAPDGWEGLVDALTHAGVDLGVAQRAGLVKAGHRGGYYDVYRGRLMIPTRATTGETIAFGGRIIGDGEPKYLNTSTTPVYTKGRHLFALGAARRAAQREGAIVVVEGYLDCIALHQAGLAHAVASLGTAFTPEQAQELGKATGHVFVCFDGDAAGQAATAKSVDTLVRAGIAARIVTLPAGEDPDSYVRTHGADGFRKRLDEAVPWIQFKLDRELEALASGFTSAAEIARRAEGLVQALPRAEWDRWRVYVASRLGLNIDDLRKSRLVLAPAYYAPKGAPGAAPQARHVMPTVSDTLSFERDVLAIILEEPALLQAYRDRIPADRFVDPHLRAIYFALRERAEAILQPAEVFAVLSEDGNATATLAAIGSSERSNTVRFADTTARRDFLDRLIERFAKDDLRREFSELDARVDALLETGQVVPADLRAEHARLAAVLKK